MLVHFRDDSDMYRVRATEFLPQLRKSKCLEQIRGFLREISVGRKRSMHRELSSVQGFARQQHVLQDGEVWEQLCNLKSSGDPSRRPTVGREPGHVSPKERNCAVSRSELAADQIEQRRLASSVRSYESMPFAWLNGQIHAVDCSEAAEISGDVLEYQAGMRTVHI